MGGCGARIYTSRYTRHSMGYVVPTRIADAWWSVLVEPCADPIKMINHVIAIPHNLLRTESGGNSTTHLLFHIFVASFFHTDGVSTYLHIAFTLHLLLLS